MDKKEILARCEAIITDVDIEIMNWHHEIDLMAFIGQDVPLVLYTDDRRLEVGTARLVHNDGALTMTGEITSDLDHFVDQHGHSSFGSYSLGFDTEDKKLTAVSLAPKAVAHFNVDADGTWHQNVPLRSDGGELRSPNAVNIPVERRLLPENLREKIRAKIDDNLYLENHPFFDPKEND